MNIIVNGKEVETDSRFLNYSDIVKATGMSYREHYTVTYHHSRGGGTIIPSDYIHVMLAEGMIFNVSHTGGA